nr:glycosyltransferase [Pantoea sp. 201603H]
MNHNNNHQINIAYCTDANYLEYVATSITSVIMNNMQASLAFYVFVYDVSSDDIEKLKKTSPYIEVFEMEKSDIDKYQTDFKIKHLNRSTYMRLAVPRLLKDKVDTFIYLDADTLCFDDISAITEIDVSKVICAVGHDSLDAAETKHAKRLGLNVDNYFNAGFLYINVENWISNGIEEKANEILFEKAQELPYLDQDALNIAMAGNVTFIDNKWNFIHNWYTETQKDTYFYDKSDLPRIVHFTGGRKPWFKEHEGLSQQLFSFYHHFTPWRNEPLRSFSSRMRPTDYRVYSRQHFQRRQFGKAIVNYLKYLKAKFKP